MLPGGGLRAPATPFNRAIGPHRRWAFRTLPLDDVKAVKNAAGSTVNDVVMALCAGALRRWLLDHDALPDSPLVAAVPVSVRTDDQKDTHGNRVSSMIAPLPTHLADAAERLRATPRGDARRQGPARRAARDPARRRHPVRDARARRPGGAAVGAAPAGRAGQRVQPDHLERPRSRTSRSIYAGARLVAYYPLSAIADGQGLNITVMSFDGQLHVGLIADRDLVPDLDAMAGYLADELVTLRAVASAQPASYDDQQLAAAER